jgi:site-specific DNA recombinase
MSTVTLMGSPTTTGPRVAVLQLSGTRTSSTVFRVSAGVEVIDEVVVDYIESTLLREDVVVAALAEVRRRLKQRADEPSELPELERQAKRLQGEVRRLGEALLSTQQPLDTITSMLAEREGQLRELNSSIAAHRAAPSVLNIEAARLEKDARARAEDLRGMLRRSTSDGRKALEKVLTGPLLFTPIETPDGRRFQVTGEGQLGSVIGSSIAGVPKGIRTPVTALKGPCPGPG